MRAEPKVDMPVKSKYDKNAPVMTIDDIKEVKGKRQLCCTWFNKSGDVNKGCFSEDVLEKYDPKKDD